LISHPVSRPFTTSTARTPTGATTPATVGYGYETAGQLTALAYPAGRRPPGPTTPPAGSPASPTAPPSSSLAPWRALLQPDTRWTQQDSIERPGDLAEGNRYAYATDDPINETDPSGQCSSFFGCLEVIGSDVVTGFGIGAAAGGATGCLLGAVVTAEVGRAATGVVTLASAKLTGFGDRLCPSQQALHTKRDLVPEPPNSALGRTNMPRPLPGSPHCRYPQADPATPHCKQTAADVCRDACR